jgi:uncharacterized repeat protein (TIGR01451 family)
MKATMEKMKQHQKPLIRNFVLILILLSMGSLNSQTSSYKIRWQKTYGAIYDASICNHSFKESSNSFVLGIQDTFNKLIKVDTFGIIKWQRIIDSFKEITTFSKTSDKGFIVGGHFKKNNIVEYDIWLAKIDSLGNKLWSKTYGGNGRDVLYSILILNNGNIVICGSSTSSKDSGNKKTVHYGHFDYWIIMLNQSGNEIWQKTFGGDGNDVLNKAIITSTNSILLVGTSNSGISGNKSSNSKGNYDYWVVNIDHQGNKIFDKSYGGVSDEFLYGGIKENQGNFIISGYSESSKSGDVSDSFFGEKDVWVVCINSMGNILWNKLLGGSLDDIGYSIDVNLNGDILLGCTSSSLSSATKNDTTKGGDDYWICKLDINGTKLWDLSLGSAGYDMLRQIMSINDKHFFVVGHSWPGISQDRTIAGGNVWLLSIKEPNHLIEGKVYADFNSNCMYNPPSEYSLKNFIVYNSIEQYGVNVQGDRYFMPLFYSDSAVLKILNLDSNLYVACGRDSIKIDLRGKTDTAGIDFPIRSNKTGHCINISSLSAGLLRPGGWSDYHLNYQNNAFDTAYNAYIEIEVDTLAIDTIKSLFSFTLTGNVLRFNLGHVRPFGYSSVSYSIKLKTTVIIGSMHCHRAKVFPICNLYPSTVYDSSVIQPMIRCLPNDTVEFTLRNIGTKDQKDWGLVKSYEDIIIFKIDSFKLNKSDVRIWKHKLDINKVYTAEVYSSNHHPVTPILIRQNDLCVNKRTMIPQNTALNFSRRDEAKEYEEACMIVRGSYDPNIKSVQPVGMYAEHYTSTGTELKYRIDFQNTGTDTAFRVLLIDTLSSFLNIASFVPGVSSHPYSVEFGGRAVKFIFDPIRLVDSGTNEPASHGYVNFKIKHIPGISPNARIENKVDIYFDYNTPIRTNTVLNTIFDTIHVYIPKTVVVDTFLATPDSLKIPALSNNLGKIDIKSNKAWTASSNQSWLTLSASSGFGNTQLTLSAQTNTGVSRTARIELLSVGSPPILVKVIQNDSIKPNMDTVIVSPDSLNVPAYSNSLGLINIQTTKSWTANSDKSWATLSLNSGIGSKQISIQASTNVGSKRVAIISILSGSSIIKTVKLTQMDSQTKFLIVSPDTIFAPAATSNNLQFFVNSNTSWSFLNTHPWLSLNTNSGANNKSITLNIQANSSTSKRTATITATSSNAPSKNLVIVQAPSNYSQVNNAYGHDADIYPIPARDKFYLYMSEPIKDLSIEIYDMQGRLTKSLSSTNSQTLEVTAEGMTKGIYHIRVLSGEKLVVVKKVMVE